VGWGGVGWGGVGWGGVGWGLGGRRPTKNVGVWGAGAPHKPPQNIATACPNARGATLRSSGYVLRCL